MSALLPLAPHDHPDPHTFAWSEAEMRAIRQYATECVDAATAELRTRIAALEADAARYRWLYDRPSRDRLDAAIDAAMQAALEHEIGTTG